jgi:hypothetical protein
MTTSSIRSAPLQFAELAGRLGRLAERFAQRRIEHVLRSSVDLPEPDTPVTHDEPPSGKRTVDATCRL